jgi:hypothetical protein
MAKQTINIGSIANDGTGSTLRAAGDLVNDNFNEIYSSIGDGTTLTNILAAGYITTSSTDTLTNKSISLTDNTVSGTTAEFNSALSDGSFATLAGTETLTNKTLTDAVVVTNSDTGEVIPGKQADTNFPNSLIIGHSTTGTLSGNATTQGKNTAVGLNSMTALTSGFQNTILGAFAGQQLTTGVNNLFVGAVAGQNGTTHNSNTYVGTNAGTNATGSSGVALGYGALINSTGSQNIAIGQSAGDNITSGAGNVIIGTTIDAPSATGDRQLVIAGYDGTTTTTWISGDSSGNVTIGGALTGTTLTGTTIDASNNTISNIEVANLASGVLDTDLNSVAGTDTTLASAKAIKTYVDTIAAAGIHYHDPVRVESPINLNAAYDNGTAGVGATLTNSGTLAAISIDGVALSLNDRALIYNQTNAAHNGIYYVSTVGDGATAWVLTRTTDTDSYGASDPDSLGEGDAFFVREGATGAGELYVMTTSGTITFGTTNITFSVIAETAVYSAGQSLTLSGTEFSVTSGSISSTQLTSAVQLQILDSSGSVVKSLYGSGS